MKTKLIKSMKVLLVAAGLGAGVNGAWAENYKTILTLDFEDADTYKVGWSQSENYDVNLSQVEHGTGKALYLNGKSSRGSSLTYSFAGITSLTNSTEWKIEFDWATCGVGANNNARGGIEIYSGSNIVFSALLPSTANATTVTFIDGTTLTVPQRLSTPSPWLHIVLTGKADGVYATVINTTANPNTTLLDNVKVYASTVSLTSFVALNARSYQNMYLDDIVCSIDLESYTSRATAASSVYASINGSVMNPTEKSALDAAYSTLSTDYDTDEKIVADIEGYVSAITALETANANAQASIDGYAILNNLIANAAGLDGYVAPTGAETAFTANPATDVNLTTLTAAVRAAIITAGTASENTDMTALIANSSFELGNTLGWTTVDSDDTGARTYATTGQDGTYLFNNWAKGTPITQTLGTLPAGQYKLECLVASNGGTIYLTMNDTHNNGTLTSGDGGNFVDAAYTFTLGSDTEVTIGAVGGDGDGSFLAEGHWWYKADKFTLTYIGEDPLEQAKMALSNEITAATTMKNTYTAKVGTAPFLYPIDIYNTLVGELTEAQAVIEANGDVVSVYTTAQSELEAAKEAMNSATQNVPDADEYYRIYVASDGSASAYNLNLLSALSQAKVTATPYAVKFVADGTTGRYNIRDPYGYSLSTDGNGTIAMNSSKAVQVRCASVRITLNDNGTVSLGGYRSSTSTQYYAASASEGALVTAVTGNTGTWVISDAVDVTEVNLAVNAAAGWGTFIAPYDNVIPSTVKAYTVSHKNGSTIYFTENETGVLSANTPYILSTEEAENVSTTFKGIANNSQDTYTENGLVGLLTAGTVDADKYILQYNDGKVGFYKTTEAITGTANRCYLDLDGVPSAPVSSARSFVGFGLFDGETTGVKTVDGSQQEAENLYNLSGQRIIQPTKGLYIVSGKKVVVK